MSTEATEYGFIPHLPNTPEAINADSFDEDVLESPILTLVEFWAARCAPCRRLSPDLEQLAKENAGRLRVFTLNVDEELPAALRFDVTAIPALLLFASGQEIDRYVGLPDYSALIEWVRPYLQNDKPTEG